jgi:hypothetical protein
VGWRRDSGIADNARYKSMSRFWPIALTIFFVAAVVLALIVWYVLH